MPFVPNENKIENFSFTINTHVDGYRLDQYLVRKFPDYSRAYLQKMIKNERVLVGGKPAKPSAKLHTGQDVSVSIPKLEPLHLQAEEMPLDVIYEDDDLAALNKPPHLVIHPARGHLSGTLVNALLAYFDDLAHGSDAYRPGIVHRLDRDTSGVLLIAKTEKAQACLGHQFENRLIKKEYLALLEGELNCPEGTIALPLGMDLKNRERMTIQHGGKEAITDYRVLALYPGFTLVHVFPRTGRTHQIRVHFKSQGYPIVGDHLYGASLLGVEQVLTKLAKDSGKQQMQQMQAEFQVDEILMARQALHAWHISFEHPTTKQQISLEAPLAPDFSRTLQFFQFLWPSATVKQMFGDLGRQASDPS